MPLLIPGLDEVATKKLAKRLRKSLVEHPGVPSLTQLQTLLAQAAGHADFHAAQHYWATQQNRSNTADRNASQQSADEIMSVEDRVIREIARRQVDAVLPKALQDLEYSYEAANRAMGSMEALMEGLDRLTGPVASLDAPSIRNPLQRQSTVIVCPLDEMDTASAHDLIQELQHMGQTVVLADPPDDPKATLDRMRDLLLQLQKQLNILLHSQPPARPGTLPKPTR